MNAAEARFRLTIAMVRMDRAVLQLETDGYSDVAIDEFLAAVSDAREAQDRIVMDALIRTLKMKQKHNPNQEKQ